MICFSMFDIVSLLLKKKKRLILFLWFGVLCCWRVFHGGLGEKALFRAG